jgi:hypothetical protein
MDETTADATDGVKTWQRYAGGFGLMAWAFVFFLQLGSVSVAGCHVLVLPAVLGWAFMLLAARRLRGLDDATEQIARTARAGLIITVPLIVAFPGVPLPVYGALAAASAVLSVVACWTLCNMIARAARRLDRADVAAAADWRRVLMPLVYTGTLCALGVMALSGQPTAEAGRTGIDWSTVALMYAAFLFGAVALTVIVALMATSTRMCIQAARTERERRSRDAALNA